MFSSSIRPKQRDQRPLETTKRKRCWPDSYFPNACTEEERITSQNHKTSLNGSFRETVISHALVSKKRSQVRDARQMVLLTPTVMTHA